MAESAGHLVWIDCEMTGLDIVKDKLIEVAVLVTDSELNVLDPGLDLIISADDADLDGMNEVVVEMHRKSGLTDAVRASTLTVAEAEQQLLAYIKRWVPDRRTAPLCGNSIGTDRGFLARDMPELDDHLHYRMVDVSSVKELARRWFPRVYFAQPPKGLAHRALADIIESVRELAYYRRTLFVPAPGPNGEQAKGAADEVVGVVRRAAGRRGREPAGGRRHGDGRSPGRVGRLTGSGIVAPVPHRRSRPAGRRGGCSSVGRAPGCDPGCRGFEPRHSPHAERPWSVR